MRAGTANGTPAILCAAEFFDLIHGRERERERERGERREEREGLEAFAFDHQQRTKAKGDESQGNRNGSAEQSAADNERKGEACERRTFARRGHKRRGERERCATC